MWRLDTPELRETWDKQVWIEQNKAAYLIFGFVDFDKELRVFFFQYQDVFWFSNGMFHNLIDMSRMDWKSYWNELILIFRSRDDYTFDMRTSWMDFGLCKQMTCYHWATQRYIHS